MKQIDSILKTWFTAEKVGIYIVLGFLLLWFCAQRYTYQFDGKVSLNDTSAPVTKIALQKGKIEQQVRWVADVDYLDFMVQNKGKTPEKIKVKILREDQSCVSQQTVEVPAGKEKQSVSVPLHTKEGAEAPGEKKLFRLCIEKLEKKSQIVFFTQPKDVYENAYTTKITGTDQQLRMDITYAMSEKYTCFYLMTGAVFLGGCILFFWKKRTQIERVFLVVVLSAGVLLAMSNPASQECDGYDHLMRSMDVSYGNVLSPFMQLTHQADEIALPENFDTLRLERVISPKSCYGSFAYQRQTQESFSKEAKVISYQGGVNSLFYLPQALGLWIGRNLGISAYLTMVLARVLNLLCYAALVFFAVKKLPCAKTLMVVIALMPISVYQAASFSPDALLNGFCMLFIATCLSYAYSTKKKELGTKEALTLGILLAIVFLCKYVYAILGLLVFLIPKERFQTRKNYWKKFTIALIPVAIAVALVSMGLTNSVSQTQAVNALGQSQIMALKEKPFFFVTVLIKTLDKKLVLWIEGLATYGWMNYPLGILVFLVPILLVVTAALAPDRVRQNPKSSHTACMVTTFFLISGMLLLALYVGDGRINPVGASVVEGIQGRYFIPILFLPFFALSSPKVENRIPYFANKVLGVETLMLGYSVTMLMGYCY
ncbi:MAG: DUF2142 domain-containing protein [Lachnospiraceae bacterium]